MIFSLATALFALAASVAAQTVHTVTVGDGGQLKFDPQNITIPVGDKVAFEFRAKNHTATQSTFANPCTPGTFNGSAGVNSGFMPIPANNSLQPGQFPTWTITVNTDQPLWFFCAQANHCQSGMVFSINATPEKSFAAFLANAMSANPTTAAAPSTGATNPAAASGATNTTASSGAGAAPGAGSAATGAANAGANSAASGSNTAEASQETVGTNGASALFASRGAAGLLATLAIGSILI